MRNSNLRTTTMKFSDRVVVKKYLSILHAGQGSKWGHPSNAESSLENVGLDGDWMEDWMVGWTWSERHLEQFNKQQ